MLGVGKEMGDKPPYDDEDATHGICEECRQKYFPKTSDRSLKFEKLEEPRRSRCFGRG